MSRDGASVVPSLLTICVDALEATHEQVGAKSAPAAALCTVSKLGNDRLTSELARWWWWLYKRHGGISLTPIERHPAAALALMEEVQDDFDLLWNASTLARLSSRMQQHLENAGVVFGILSDGEPVYMSHAELAEVLKFVLRTLATSGPRVPVVLHKWFGPSRLREKKP